MHRKLGAVQLVSAFHTMTSSEEVNWVWGVREVPNKRTLKTFQFCSISIQFWCFCIVREVFKNPSNAHVWTHISFWQPHGSFYIVKVYAQVQVLIHFYYREAIEEKGKVHTLDLSTTDVLPVLIFQIEIVWKNKRESEIRRQRRERRGGCSSGTARLCLRLLAMLVGSAVMRRWLMPGPTPTV